MSSDSAQITVFHVRNSNYAGGIETTLFGWFKYADTKRFHQRLFLFQERRQLHWRSMEILEDNGISCELLPWGFIRNLPGAVYKLRKAVKASSRAVLHSHDTRSDLVALIVARLTGTPLIVSNHAWHPADFKRKILEGIRAFLMRGADVIISVSEDTHRETLEKGLNPEKCMALYSGIDLEPYQKTPSKAQARQYLGVPDNCFIVGNMARLWPEKEQATIIDAARILAPRYPDMRFVIVGDGPLADALKEKIHAENLQNVVLLPGFKDDFVAALAAMDCFAFPSSAEGTPMVIYSAMAMGLPIVASPVSGVGEILKHKTSSLLVPPADSKQLAAALEKIYLDPDFAKSIGDAARGTVKLNYSAKHAVHRLQEIYLKLAYKRPGTRLMLVSEQTNQATPDPIDNKTPKKLIFDSRRSPRISCNFPISVELENGWTVTAWTHNISAEGLLLEYSTADIKGYSIKADDRLRLVLNSPFFMNKCTQKRLYRVVDAPGGSDNRGLLRLELASDVTSESKLGGYAVIKPADYVVPVALEMEFLKILELINFRLPDHKSKLLVITSSQEKAGVSTFSWWFSSCLARMAGHRVLFIDGNLHQPHEVFVDCAGLLDVLHGKCQLDDAVIDPGHGCPHILNGGNASDYLAGQISEKMIGDTFAALHNKYDYVIVDTPPANTSPFTLMLAREADGTLLVIESKKTKREHAKDTLDLLDQVGCNVLGALLNRV